MLAEGEDVRRVRWTRMWSWRRRIVHVMIILYLYPIEFFRRKLYPSMIKLMILTIKWSNKTSFIQMDMSPCPLLRSEWVLWTLYLYKRTFITCLPHSFQVNGEFKRQSFGRYWIAYLFLNINRKYMDITPHLISYGICILPLHGTPKLIQICPSWTT